MTLNKESLQEAVGSSWEVTDVSEASYELDMVEIPSEQRNKLLIEVEKVRNIAYYYQEKESLALVDAVWRAAESLLGPKKFSALQRMYAGDAADTLTDLVVGAAIISAVVPTEAKAAFIATEELRAGIVKQTEAELLQAEAAEDAKDLTGEDRIVWECSTKLGWTELLPEAFELSKLGPWESDERFTQRCKATLEKIAALFPRAD